MMEAIRVLLCEHFATIYFFATSLLMSGLIMYRGKIAFFHYIETGKLGSIEQDEFTYKGSLTSTRLGDGILTVCFILLAWCLAWAILYQILQTSILTIAIIISLLLILASILCLAKHLRKKKVFLDTLEGKI
jgi:cobalamin biosynthesis protein CobD/CbiB